ncbi:hypothetical protein [Desulfosporosinus acidiphilus]|uniref:hypothetical protein n=1 Tax=Desulfosporosinus acidiphilus TaxID=885581 RepID=UPI0011D2BBA4|nr:hypothetical protein [Desulfosporosinus acidiphilus]
MPILLQPFYYLSGSITCGCILQEELIPAKTVSSASSISATRHPPAITMSGRAYRRLQLITHTPECGLAECLYSQTSAILPTGDYREVYYNFI